jgi:hypothetical protein
MFLFARGSTFDPPRFSFFFVQVLHLTLVSAVQLATKYARATALQRDAISAFMSLEEEGQPPT